MASTCICFFHTGAVLGHGASAVFSKCLFSPNWVLVFAVGNFENLIKGFELVAVGLRECEVHDGNESDVETEEYKIRLPRYCVDHDRRQLHHGVVEDPVCGCREPVGFGTDPNRCYFCWI